MKSKIVQFEVISTSGKKGGEKKKRKEKEKIDPSKIFVVVYEL